MKATDLKRLMALTGKRCTLPIIEKTALIFRGTATSTNLETTLTVKTDIKGEGVIDLNAVKSAGKYDSAWIEGETLHIKKGTGIMKSFVREVKDFPELPHTPLSQGNITIADVERMQRVAKYAGSDELRPAMSGLYTNGKHFVGTDAHKMAWDFCRGKDIPEVIIPKSAVNMLSNVSYKIKIGLNNPDYGDPHIINIAFINSDETLVCRVIEGRYPNFTAVIPRLSDIQAIINTADLKRAVNDALPFSNKSTFQGRFHFKPGKLTISSRDIDFANEFSETIEAEFSGAKEFVIGLNLNFMKQSLAPTTDDRVELLMSEPSSAVIFNKKILLMPVMLDEKGQRIDLETKSDAKPIFELGQYVNVQDHLLDEYYTGKITKIDKPVADGRIAYRVEYPGVNCKGEPSSEKIWAWENYITLAETPAEPTTESPIIADSEIGKISEASENVVVCSIPKHEPDPEPETQNPEPETPNPALIVIESHTDRAFAIIGSIDMLPEEFCAKYASNTKIKIENDRVPGLMFSKKRRAMLAELLTANGIQFLSM